MTEVVASAWGHVRAWFATKKLSRIHESRLGSSHIDVAQLKAC